MKKNRKEKSLFVVEGQKSIEEAIRCLPEKIESIFTSDEAFFNDYSQTNQLNIELVSEKEMAKISHLKTPSKALAVVQYFELAGNSESKLSIALDSIQDPGNLGTIIRIADWFGVREIICSEDTVDCYNSKVVQATMGSLFRVKLTYTNLNNYLKNFEGNIVGAFMNGTDVRNYSLKESSVLVMGNEGKGISSEIESLIEERVTIVGSGNTESLNVAIATGILVSHLNC